MEKIIETLAVLVAVFLIVALIKLFGWALKIMKVTKRLKKIKSKGS